MLHNLDADMGRSNRISTDEHDDGPAKAVARWDGVLGRTARDIVFFVPFGIFLWRVVGTHLIFHGAGRITAFPSFYTTWQFFARHLSAPGGPVEYTAAFLSQLFHYAWLGAIVITLQAWSEQ